MPEKCSIGGILKEAWEKIRQRVPVPPGEKAISRVSKVRLIRLVHSQPLHADVSGQAEVVHGGDLRADVGDDPAQSLHFFIVHHAIVDHLRRCDLFLVIASHAAGSSLFCAFEAGMAVALNKPVRLVLLDDAALPAYVSGLQAVDVPRLMKRKPWLDACDAVLDACLTAIAGR